MIRTIAVALACAAGACQPAPCGASVPTLTNPSFTRDTAGWATTGPSLTRDTVVFDSGPAGGAWGVPTQPPPLSSGLVEGAMLTSRFEGVFRAGCSYRLTMRLRGGARSQYGLGSFDVRWGQATSHVTIDASGTWRTVALTWTPGRSVRTGLRIDVAVLYDIPLRTLYIDTVYVTGAEPTTG